MKLSGSSRSRLAVAASLLSCSILASCSSSNTQQASVNADAERVALEQRNQNIHLLLDVKECEARLQRNPKDLAALRGLGLYYLVLSKGNNLPKSIYYWREAVRLEPKNTVTKDFLASALMQNGQRAEAIQVFDEIAATNTQGAGAYGKYLQEDVDHARIMAAKLRRKSR